MTDATTFFPVPDSIAPPVRYARLRQRHGALMASFALTVALPLLLLGWYLFAVAADQYASYAGFTVRQEKPMGQIEMLGGLTSLGGGGSTDSDVLFEFIRSQEIVSLIDRQMKLRAIWAAPRGDPLFRFGAGGKVEDLQAYWSRMVTVSYDANTGLMDLRVLAFSAEDARAVARAIFEQSSKRINELSAIAREDASRHAREELADAVTRLKAARLALSDFRSRHQLIDPSADLQGQMGLLNSLQSQQADALIELDLLREVTQEGDSRIDQARRKIAVIEARIAEERRKLGSESRSEGEGRAFTTVVGQYEALRVDLEFAEQSYLAAQGALDLALAEARRKSRYLAAHVAPTLAESPRFPQRAIILSLTALFLFLSWAILVLIGYSVRDRR